MGMGNNIKLNGTLYGQEGGKADFGVEGGNPSVRRTEGWKTLTARRDVWIRIIIFTVFLFSHIKKLQFFLFRKN